MAVYSCAAFLVVCLVIILSTNAQPEPAKNIFILAGQSNMVGRGGVLYDNINNRSIWDGYVPLPDNTPDPSRVLRLTANLTWEAAHDPLHLDIDVAPNMAVGVGPGMTFSNVIKESSSLPIGLVPCAIGGSEIKEWARGRVNYENMLKRAKVASMWGDINGLLWYQGESDTDSDDQVNSYHDNLVNFILNVRADLNLPHLPIIQVAIANASDPGRLEKIREIQKGIQLPNLACVDALGLEIGGDHIHLTTPAQVKLGHMLAEAYSELSKSPSTTSSSPP